MAGNSEENRAKKLQMRLGKRGNRLKTPFEIQVVEHVYDGSQRWREKDVGNSYQVHTHDTTSPVAREPKVRQAIENAWGRDSPGQSDPSVQGRFSEDIYDLMTCTNTTCQQRTQAVAHGRTHIHSGEAPCSKCGKPLSLIHCIPLENKWLYVLTGSDMKLSHEIYANNEHEWLDCKACWVVELAIQEQKSNPDILAFGIAYYCFTLKDIMASPVEQAYVVRLSAKYTERIPYKFILKPDMPEQTAITEMRKISGDLAVQLYILMMPAFIATTDSLHATDKFVLGLKMLGIEALVTGDINEPPAFGYKGIMLVKNSLLAIDEKRVEKNLSPLLPKRIRGRILPGLKLFSELETPIEALFSLYMGLKVYTEEEEKNESWLDRFVRQKGQWEYPFKAAKLITDMKKLHLALWAKKEFGIDLAKYAAKKADYLIDGSSEAVKRRLLDQEAMLLLERNAKFYRYATRVTKFLAGPVAIVFGGMDIIIQGQETIRSWENGNMGGAAGSGLLLSAAAIGVGAAIVETAAMIGCLTAATAEMLVGPLGIFAALITVGSMLVFHLFSKSDLELYALHCFLGDGRGKGSSSQGPNWAEGKSYSSWQKLVDSPIKQNQFLINLISSLKVMLRHLPLMGTKAVHYGCFVQTGWLPPGALCEVIVIGTYEDTGKNNKQRITQVESTAYVDLDTGEYVVKRDSRYPAPKVSINAYPYGSWGKKTFRYFTVSLDHRGGKLRGPIEIDRFGRNQEIYYCHVKVRIDIDSGNHNIPNGFDGTEYLELKNTEGVLGEVLKKWP